jgi:hypothetical protein
MNAILRHFAVRLWLTAILGSLLGLLWLPWWQRPFGIEWVWVPAAATLAVAFIVLGWCMNHLGRFLLHRQMREAAVWERGGLDRQARAAYDRVAALFDSFWLSPLQRRRSDRLAAGQMVRYYLAQAELTSTGRRILAAYFVRNPRDAAAAERWLEHMLEQEDHDPDEHEAAVRIGDSLAEHAHIQRLLMRFYLSTGRTDFSALQTYRRVWRETHEMPAEETIHLAHLLLAEAVINDWALVVYLQAHAAGAVECLEGITAAVRMLRPDSANRVALEQARTVCAAAGAIRTTSPSAPPRPASEVRMPIAEAAAEIQVPEVEPEQRSQNPPQQCALRAIASISKRSEAAPEPVDSEPAWRFQAGPPDDDFETGAEVFTGKETRRALKRGDRQAIGHSLGRLRQTLASAARRCKEPLSGAPALFRVSSSFKASLRKVGLAAVVVAIVVVMALAGWRSLNRPPAIVAEPAIPNAPPAVVDPFTIQVAAYLRAEDAIRFTERLRKKDLDAFYAVATSAKGKWYQVKVSHFATRSQAREFGEQLKAKGLIDDFYVANYNPEDARRVP